jgi:hypothetical protein
MSSEYRPDRRQRENAPGVTVPLRAAGERTFVRHARKISPIVASSSGVRAIVVFNWTHDLCVSVRLGHQHGVRLPGVAMGDMTTVPIRHRRIDWPHVVLLGAAVAGLWTAGGLAIWTGDPSEGPVKLFTALAMVVVLVALSVAINKLMAAPWSRLHYVFRSRHMLRLGMCLVLLTCGLSAFVAQHGLFGHLFASGQYDARDIADTGFMLALIVSAVGAGVALIEARETLKSERNWHRSLGISLR